jgi:hypothetical protein
MKMKNGGAGGGVPPPAHLKYVNKTIDELRDDSLK